MEFLTDKREGVSRNSPGHAKHTYFIEGEFPNNFVKKISVPRKIDVGKDDRPDIEQLTEQIRYGDCDPAQFYRYLHNFSDNRLVCFVFIGENQRRIPIEVLLPDLRARSHVSKRTIIVVHPPLTDKEMNSLALQLEYMRGNKESPLLIPIPRRKTVDIKLSEGQAVDVEQNEGQAEDVEQNEGQAEDVEMNEDIDDRQEPIVSESEDGYELSDDDVRVGPLSSYGLTVDIPPFPMPVIRIPFSVNVNRLLRGIPQTDFFQEYDEVVQTLLN